MSSSYNTECALREAAERLFAEGQSLMDAAEVLEKIREEKERRAADIADLKQRVKLWLDP